MARVERIKDGVCTTPEVLSNDSNQWIFFANLLLLRLHQHASLSACKPQRRVLFGTQLYTRAHGIQLSLFPEKGGRRLVTTVKTILPVTLRLTQVHTLASERSWLYSPCAYH
jgi:hypothetical protein